MYPVCPPHCLLGLGLVYHWQHCWARFAYLWFPCWLLQQMCIKRLLPCFFIAGHHHYARYISWHRLDMSVLLPDDAKEDLMAGAFVCRHKAGRWNFVSSDQFGEQTAIKIGKGGLKGISLSSFPISAYITDPLDHWYSPDEPDSSSEMPHTEEGVKSCNVDEDDRQRIRTELVWRLLMMTCTISLMAK